MQQQREELSRRQWITRSAAGLGAGALATTSVAAPADDKQSQPNSKPFRYCLNTGTILGHNLSLDEEVEVAAKAGYNGIEVWMRNVHRYVEAGKSIDDLKKRIADLGLALESAIGFPRWAVDDEEQRTEGLESMRRDMDLIAKLGGTHIAAPPAGINRTPGMDLRKVADRYRAVLEVGRETGVVPQLEIWGSAQTLGTVADAVFVTTAADHPDACLLLDAFHIYKGGSGFHCLNQLNGAAMHAFHINDYPADPPREEIGDGHRVYPGDGVCPLTDVLRTMHATGFRGALSLELFNREYLKQDTLTVVKTGLAKIRAVVAKAFA
ncbi:MAG: sugar phosphate isomerase/epimerase [Candidatus Nealsonbacteria bacterium]|nr:sugar phosphate isomerase/epimerase [Candidatus Nealsonbacteria bacterium]